jgi:hypothetical protein
MRFSTTLAVVSAWLLPAAGAMADPAAHGHPGPANLLLAALAVTFAAVGLGRCRPRPAAPPLRWTARKAPCVQPRLGGAVSR